MKKIEILDLKSEIKNNPRLDNVEILYDKGTNELEGIDFSGIFFSRVVFCKKDNAVGLKLKNCKFIDAVFNDSMLQGIIIEGCDFTNTKIIDTNFDFSFIESSIFKSSNITLSRFRESVLFWNDFRYVEFKNCTFESSKIEGCDFYRSNFHGISIFTNSEISKSSFNNVLLTGALLKKENFMKGILQQDHKAFSEFHSYMGMHRCLSKWSNFKPKNKIQGGLAQEEEELFGDYHNKWNCIRTNNKPEKYILQYFHTQYLIATRFKEAMNVYKALEANWKARGYDDDANWAYIKAKKMETKTYAPWNSWKIYNKFPPKKISKWHFNKILSKKSRVIPILLDEAVYNDMLEKIINFNKQERNNNKVSLPRSVDTCLDIFKKFYKPKDRDNKSVYEIKVKQIAEADFNILWDIFNAIDHVVDTDKILGKGYPEKFRDGRYYSLEKKLSDITNTTYYDKKNKNVEKNDMNKHDKANEIKNRLTNNDINNLKYLFIFTGYRDFNSYLISYKFMFKWLAYLFLDVFCGFGEKIVRIIFWFISLMLIFSGVYFLLGGIEDGAGNKAIFFECLFFSFKTIIGGNIFKMYPMTKLIEVLASVETFLGLIILAVFGFMLINKIRKS